jgi:hypothetical protein
LCSARIKHAENLSKEEFKLFNNETLQKRKRLNDIQSSVKARKTRHKSQPKPTPIQFVYNFDSQQLKFFFDYVELSSNNNIVPL